jgi:hypothetical protein
MLRELRCAAVCFMFICAAPALAQLCEIPGDTNCDEVVNCADVDPFVLALTDPDEYELQFPDCPITNADVNGDGYITFADIDPFTAMLELRPIKGDMNCDGCITFADIDPFVLALTDPCLYKQTYPGCPITNGDINGDGNIDSFDINPFVALLSTNEIKGDMNCDRCITQADVNPFVLALTNPAQYALQYPDCEIMNADVNGDGYINFGDIDPFVALLEGGCD